MGAEDLAGNRWRSRFGGERVEWGQLELLLHVMEVVSSRWRRAPVVHLGLGLASWNLYSIYTIFKAQSKTMGYLIKLQKVERPTNRSYYVNLPWSWRKPWSWPRAKNWSAIGRQKYVAAGQENKKTPRKLKRA